MRILIVGDSPFIKTGFGRVNSVAAKAFQEAGYTVGAVSGLSMDVVDDDNGIEMFYPQQGDVLGVNTIPSAIENFNPDLVYTTAEPGTLTAYTRAVPARLPFLAYSPVEGEPIINHDWINVLRGLDVFTCSAYGARVLKDSCGIQNAPWVYHGIDHDVFKVNGRREEIRKMLGWTDKFIIITVAANVRRKQHPRLFEAIAILKHHFKQNDIILYNHTVPFDSYWLEGWHLPEIAEAFKITESVQFNPALVGNNASIPETGLYDGIGLVDLYNAADLFVLPSQVEGFGLPIAEAMACGVPVMVTKYAAGWEVASPAGIPIPVRDWETHKSGTRYANIDPEVLAKEILRFRRSPREAVRRSETGLQRVRDFSWDSFSEKLIGYAQSAVEKKRSALSSGDSEGGSINQTEESTALPQANRVHTNSPDHRSETEPADVDLALSIGSEAT